MEGSNGEQITTKIEAPREGGPGPDANWARAMIEQGQPVRIILGNTAREDQVMLANGTPIRGVTRVEISDDAQSGRVVTLRIRNAEIISDEVEVILQTPDADAD